MENLVDNALRYGGDRIVVTVALEGGHALLSVADDGPGVASEVAERLFERFYRAPDAVADGSGLGLSIVRALAERSGGTASIDAQEDQGGFAIHLTFPLA